MTTVQLPNNNPTSSDVKADVTEATRLYMRGVAAARGGQRRVAAGLLTRSVQLDPRNEKAWLWLSGVLDDPHQIAFCLNAVLKLNPQSERAQKGLHWLEERHLLRGEPQPSALLDVEIDNLHEPDAERTARESGESWWVNWRQWRRDSRRVNMVLLSVPVVLLMIALLLYQTFALAVAESTSLPPTPVPTVAPPPNVALLSLPPVPAPIPTALPVLSDELSPLTTSKTIDYLDELEPLRQQLREAVNTFRDSTGQPGRTMGHIAAAQALHDRVEQAHTAMQQMNPPADLQAAHDAYLRGLELELEGINDLLEFYGSYRVELANRAALRFQEANSYFNNARIQFDTRLQQIRQDSAISVHTIR
ncbi:MAG: hypothetical protein HC876_01660 [Chloroflexaceae bacterium]|nr:hypothetical protein [Chloroflexaceae bacterium]NJO04332.1 hypothetical protein [Chloroflexaceae bacterium]